MKLAIKFYLIVNHASAVYWGLTAVSFPDKFVKA